ncbi:chaplin [Streptomyces fuscichromogenes]|uniref:Membrane protein n=1 Tax=Streptomyces fuscichromogenes TaxID=1324013 RepID=A0A917XJF3_9ACTN|nr:chaplin [Streptomyces fuscichromogenes]GGN28668.1 membrane protein [Streptomyces fuscichromogenes]
MRIRSLAVTGALAATLALAGTTAAHADNGAEANGFAVGSPGLLSGNVVQIPINIPINVCGNTVNIIGLLNPTGANSCTNG